MSEIKVNKISPATGTETTLGDSSDDFLLPSGAEIKAKSGSTITIESGATLANAGTATGFGSGKTIKRHYFSYGTRVAGTDTINTDLYTITSSFVPVDPTSGNNDLYVEWWATTKQSGSDHGCHGLRFDNGTTTYDYTTQYLNSASDSGKSSIAGGHFHIPAGTISAGTYSIKVRNYASSGKVNYFNLSTSDDSRITTQQQTTLMITEFKN